MNTKKFYPVADRALIAGTRWKDMTPQQLKAYARLKHRKLRREKPADSYEYASPEKLGLRLGRDSAGADEPFWAAFTAKIARRRLRASVLLAPTHPPPG